MFAKRLFVQRIASAVRDGLDWIEPKADDIPSAAVLAEMATYHLLNLVPTVIQCSGNEQPDWESDVLIPAIENFTKARDAEGDDVDYAVLVIVVIYLLYDVLRLRWKALTDFDDFFIFASLEDYIPTFHLLQNVSGALSAEYIRLKGENAESDVTLAVEMLKSILKQEILRRRPLPAIPRQLSRETGR
ncbi:hypothetical protein CC80DRAFT_554870 [Byssothecium circinans]|uniref:Uncharacterized protein n=1 Tax=Byssothecium circinans TaxID=147558 RepID=A0A6A5TE16_9PLEO|nr:hypothetical protein CC80DRAFT_554870 [Byssothecium circinans]